MYVLEYMAPMMCGSDYRRELIRRKYGENKMAESAETVLKRIVIWLESQILIEANTNCQPMPLALRQFAKDGREAIGTDSKTDDDRK